jgi:hypothetical protein
MVYIVLYTHLHTVTTKRAQTDTNVLDWEEVLVLDEVDRVLGAVGSIGIHSHDAIEASNRIGEGGEVPKAADPRTGLKEEGGGGRRKQTVR